MSIEVSDIIIITCIAIIILHSFSFSKMCVSALHQSWSKPTLASVVTLAVTSLLAVTASASEVVTNQFHVVLKRDVSNAHRTTRDVAEDIAKEHGFHVLGHVSPT